MEKQENLSSCPQIQKAWSCLKLTAMAILLLFPTLLVACQDDKQEEVVQQAAQQFAEAYFNLDFAKAAQSCTPSSRRWLELRASNLTETDLQVFNDHGKYATCKTTPPEMLNDTTATVQLTMHDFLSADSIGRTAVIKEEAHFELTLKAKGEQWLVDLLQPLFETKP